MGSEMCIRDRLLPSAQGEYYVKHVEEKLGRQVSAFTKDLVLNFVKGVCPKEQHDKLQKKTKLNGEKSSTGELKQGKKKQKR